MTIYPIPALKTNYFWLVQPDGGEDAYIFDPGDAAPVLAALAQHRLHLAGIIVTHHHWDHTDGIAPLLNALPVPVYGPDSIRIPWVTHTLSDGDKLALPNFTLDVIATPGHTLDHLAYLYRAPNGQQHLFSADNLFGAGCGRRFEGSAAEYYQSLQRLAALKDDTQVYSSHEYTLANLDFALAVEPGNPRLSQRQHEEHSKREQGLPTVPTTLAREKATNPFLRCHTPMIQQAVSVHTGIQLTDEVAVFDALRQWKDKF